LATKTPGDTFYRGRVILARAQSALDEIDRRILDVLAADGRITINDLAGEIGLSPSPTLRRVRRLEEDGVIRGYRAEIDPDAIGRGLTVWVTTRLALADADTVAAFEAALDDIDEITSAHHVTGDVDYLLRIEVADLDEYDRIVRTVLPALPGASHITSYVVTSTAKGR
jgi:Lrp/AsnC family leucine-responsive transcriptional regulator